MNKHYKFCFGKQSNAHIQTTLSNTSPLNKQSLDSLSNKNNLISFFFFNFNICGNIDPCRWGGHIKSCCLRDKNNWQTKICFVNTCYIIYVKVQFFQALQVKILLLIFLLVSEFSSDVILSDMSRNSFCLSNDWAKMWRLAGVN